MKYYHGYSIVASVFVNRFCGIGMYYSIGLFISNIQLSFGVGTGLAALFPSIVGGVSLLAVMVLGPVQDYLTKKHLGIRSTFAIGAVLLGIGAVGASYTNEFGLFLFYNVLIGIGIGFASWGSPGVITLWFVERKGLALSLGLLESWEAGLAPLHIPTHS